MRRHPILPLKPEPIEEFIYSIQGEPETRHRYYRTLKSLYRFLEDRRGITNPFKHIQLATPPRKERDHLTREQVKELMGLEMPFHDRALLTLIFDIGLRVGAICQLRREDIQDGYVLLHEKLGKQWVPISKETEAMLVQLAPSGLLFRTPKGPMNRVYLRRIISRYLDQIHYTGKKRGAHMLRHTMAPIYLERGGDMMSLSQILGHSKVSTTQIYARMAQGQLKTVHSRVSPIREFITGDTLVRAQCYGCHQEVMVELSQVKKQKCPGCGQVGKWYLPDVPAGMEES